MFLRLREAIGKVEGWGLGLLTGPVAFARQSRMFHPRGLTFAARVTPLSEIVRLPPHALLRFSSAWWKDVEWPDVLGLAVRFSASPDFAEEAKPADQDLLFATIRHPLTMPFAPLATRFHDFLANKYFAVSPFSLPRGPNAGLVKFRLVPRHHSPHGPSRDARLREAVSSGEANFELQILELTQPGRAWTPCARIELTRELALDDAALRFDPFHAGLGIQPRGLVHYLRVGAYALSQRMRPKHA